MYILCIFKDINILFKNDKLDNQAFLSYDCESGFTQDLSGHIQPSTGDTYLFRYIRIYTTIYRRYLLIQVYHDIYNHLQEILTYIGIYTGYIYNHQQEILTYSGI